MPVAVYSFKVAEYSFFDTTGAAHHPRPPWRCDSTVPQHPRVLDALVNALLERESLGELEILETTGLPTAPALLNMPQEQTNEDG